MTTEHLVFSLFRSIVLATFLLLTSPDCRKETWRLALSMIALSIALDMEFTEP